MKQKLTNAEIEGSARECGCGKPMRYYIGDKPSCNKHLACLTYDEMSAVLLNRYKQLAELENRVASFQRAQSLIVGELKRRGDDELISKVNKWVHEPLPSKWHKIKTDDDLPKDEGLYLFQVKDCEFMNIEPVNMNPEWTKWLVKCYSAWRILPKACLADD